jgi:Na+-translocating ferredoxin:NAD+ oxidoreductase subunit G
MGKSLQLVVVLSIIALVSGISLGGLNALTYETIENNVLKFKKIPAVADIYESAVKGLSDADRLQLEEDLLADKRFLPVEGGDDILFFVIRKDGAPHAVAIEDFGAGFGGDLGVMTAFELDGGGIAGIGVTTMSETPGLGTETRQPVWRKQFVGMPADVNLKVKKDGGVVDAITGATISSRAVVEAMVNARDTYNANAEAFATAAAGPAAGAGEGVGQ